MTSLSRAEDCPCRRPRKQLYQQAITLIYQQPCPVPSYHVPHYVLAQEARYAHLRGQLRRRAAVCKLQSLVCANFPAHTTRPILRPTPQCSSHAIRSFSISTQLQKKAGKANKAHARTDSAPPVSNPGPLTPTDEAYDVSGLEAQILKALEKLTHDLSQLRSGGKMNPEIVENLKVQLGTAGNKETVRLGDIAQVVPRGRMFNVICGEDTVGKTATTATPSVLTLYST